MSALTFGSSRAPLFGVYHPAQGAARARKAVLLCNPFGEEAIRAFLPFKRLAELLSAVGVPVLRFDYFGTGDSAGDEEEVALDRMASDILQADEELRELSEARQTYWVALRLGAWAAIEAAQETPPAGLLLWEPVTDGQDYLLEIGEGEMPEGEAQGFLLPAAMATALGGEAPAVPDGLALKVIGPNAYRGHDALTPPTLEPWNSDAAMNSYRVPLDTLEMIRAEVVAW